MSALIPTLMPALNELPWYVYATFGLLVIGTCAFIALFCWPAWRVGHRLKRVLRNIKSDALSGSLDIGDAFAEHEQLKHHWSEFRETLHEERATNAATRAVEVVSLRATLPAATFFTEESMVDAPLRADFFKHLPGIFTGIGIIGTFTGLLFGLRDFRVSDNAGMVRESLGHLLRGVSEAFTISAFAIALAMILTLFEKIILVRLYGRVRSLTQAIDERYKAGIGEEYLARLVGATEESATQGKILKDALVGDLKTILTELSERQITAFGQSQAQLGAHISESVATQLKGPLERLAAVSESVRGDQGAAVQQLMADLLARFTDRIENLFGGQMSGIQEMQQQTITALREAVGQLQRMSQTVEGAGQKASEALTERLNETLHKLDQRQLVMTEEVRKFVHEIRSLVGESQTESHHRLQTLLTDLAQQTGTLVSELSQKSQSAVGAMGTQVAGLSGKVEEAVTQIGAAIGKLESVTTDAIGRMNSSAETLALAADDFARAGTGVSGVLAQAQGLTGQLTQSATSLTTASRSMDTLLADYRATRDTVAQMLEVVKSTVEAARREASLTTDILQRLESSSEKLAGAQRAADEYLQKITDVLATSHQAFADSISRTLNSGNREFLDAISTATKMLRETIMELCRRLVPGGGSPSCWPRRSRFPERLEMRPRSRSGSPMPI
jgi:ABC-type transporter Mla subunit MlaD